ncbi:MAG: hypothetical protein M1840_006336 [Geoglossum simile]|nr:MAG: hypothetical protein M1840_006336 [Geoglossum simile]
MSVLDWVSVEGIVNYHIRTDGISKKFSISAGENTVELALAFVQEEGKEIISIHALRGLSPKDLIYFLKVEWTLRRNDGQPDPPIELDKLQPFERPVHDVAHGSDYLPEDEVHICADHLPLYLEECSWGRDDAECVTGKLMINGKVDFGDIEIDTNVDLHVMTPNEPPYGLTFSIVRDPEDLRRGRVQLRATDPSEKRKTPVRGLFIRMSMGEEGTSQHHCLPPTPNEGGFYALTVSTKLPLYGTHLLNAAVEITLPAAATIKTVPRAVEDDWVSIGGLPNTPNSSVVI